MLVWVDVETTGLGLDSKLLEVGIVISTNIGIALHEKSVIIRQDVDYDKVDNVVLAMHANNNLWKEVKTIGIDMGAAEDQLIEFIYEVLENNCYGPMCGASVHFDRLCLEKNMPRLASKFTYRNIDVSTLHQVAKRAQCQNLHKDSDKRNCRHRALDDLHDSIARYEHYIKFFNRERP